MKRLGMDMELEQLEQAEKLGVQSRPPNQAGEGVSLPPGTRGRGTQGGVVPLPTRQEQEMGARL